MAEPEEEDLTDKYNTPLTRGEELRYQQWAKQNKREKDTFDYDMRGAWKEGVQADPQSGHFPDTYKKPNHPTFSNESKYHGADGRMGGRWDADETGSETLQPYDPRFEQGGLVRGLPQQGSANIEDRRNEPPPEQGEGDDDRVEPTDEDRARDSQMMEDIKSGKAPTPPTYGTEEFRRRPVGPQDDQDFEPRHKKMQRLMSDPEHGSWHDDGKYQVYTPHPSFFANVDPRDLVEHFKQNHPEDHKINLP